MDRCHGHNIEGVVPHVCTTLCTVNQCCIDPTFRVVADEVLDGPDGPARVITCEDLDPESGRWEPFVSITPARRATGSTPRRADGTFAPKPRTKKGRR